MTTVDPIGALVTYLKADAAVSARAGTRVYGASLPNAGNTAMPDPSVVIRPAGGGGAFGRGGQQFADRRIDTDCYAATEHDSWLLYLDVSAALKELLRVTVNGVLLHWARVSAEGQTARDPETNWPLTIASYQILAAEIPAA